MNVSSIASTFISANATQALQNRNEQVEGTTPDKDGDRDDTVNTTTKSATVSSTIGSKLNVIT